MSPQSLKNPRQAWSVLIVSTLAFTVCFMVWMMFGVIGIPIKNALALNATEFGLLTATPVLTGSLIRVPLGIWTDKYGGRIVMATLMALTVVVFWLFSHSDPVHLTGGHVKFTDQLKALKDPKVIKYCQYYSIVFGGYVALSLWMVQYYVGEYGLDIRVAALLAACFSLPGGVLRAIGGVLSDKYGAHSVTWWVMWVSWICLFLLSYPQTDFTILTVNGPTTFHIGLNVYAFTALMGVLGVAFAFGKASVFKYISDDYPKNIGAISGIVGLAGGLGGFVLPIMFGALMDFTGIRSSAFMLMYGVVWVSLIWMYFTEVRRTDVMDPTGASSAGAAR